jgi:protein-disulfide isomerase
MRRYALIGMVIAAVVAVVAVVLLVNKSPSEGATTTEPSSVERAYLYSVKIQGSREAVQMSAVYILLKDGVLFGEVAPHAFSYYMFKDDGVVNELAMRNGIYWKFTYFSRPAEVCKNTMATATIAGEKLTITNSLCVPSSTPLATAKRLDELVLLIHLFPKGLPYPTLQSHWKRSGTVQTPFGEAAIYTSATRAPTLGRDAVLIYEKQVLKDGSIYLFKVQLAYGTQVATTLTYTLQNITTVTPELRSVINELYKDVSAKPGGGLDILKVAQKIGMSYDGRWPAAIVFFDLQCPYCALLFKYNYTLFQGHKLVLVDLIVHPDAQPAHEQLRCLYQTSPDEVIPTLRVLYDRFLAQDPNYTSVLPQSRCPFDASAGQQLATMLLTGRVVAPATVVVYPNDTYTVITGYRPAEIAKALKG